MGGVGLYHHAPLTVPEAVVTPARNNRTNTYVRTYIHVCTFTHVRMYVYKYSTYIVCTHTLLDQHGACKLHIEELT